jgi:hypothetical protein
MFLDHAAMPHARGLRLPSLRKRLPTPTPLERRVCELLESGK